MCSNYEPVETPQGFKEAERGCGGKARHGKGTQKLVIPFHVGQLLLTLRGS